MMALNMAAIREGYYIEKDVQPKPNSRERYYTCTVSHESIFADRWAVVNLRQLRNYYRFDRLRYRNEKQGKN